MDKLLIIAFRTEIASAILNSQEKLNPNNDAYIDSDEMPAILNFFGVDDVQKLLKNTNNDSINSIFTQQENSQDKNNVDTEDYTNRMNSDQTVLREDGSAAYELQNTLSADLITSSNGTPYEAQMKNLYETRKALIKNQEDTSNIDAKINAMNEAVQEYIKIHQEDITKAVAENGAVKQFIYGEDGNKTGYYLQTFNVKANNTITQDDNSTNENSTDREDDTPLSQAVGGITYNVELSTEKLHAIGHIDADTENSDISAVAVYKDTLKNGSRLNFSGNFRQTIEKGNNQTHAGASIDYSHNKFNAGGYAAYKMEEAGKLKHKTVSTEGYIKYGKLLRISAGLSNESFADIKFYERYAQIKLSGSANLADTNLKLVGAMQTKYSALGLELGESNKEDFSELNLNASGGISFKSNTSDFSASILANINVDKIWDAQDGNETSIASTLLGNISTDKVDVTTTLTALNSVTNASENNSSSQKTTDRKTNWSSSITIGLKNLFGKNVTPSFTYNLNSEDTEKKHNVAINLGIHF